jgi:hypothetical protein
MSDKVSSIKKRLDVDEGFLRQAWRNTEYETVIPLQDVVDLCHAEPFYRDYTDHLLHNGMKFDDAVKQTETVAMGMINLLYNRSHLEQETREQIASSIMLRLKFGLEMAEPYAETTEEKVHIHHGDLDMHIPKSANNIMNEIIYNTRDAFDKHRASRDHTHHWNDSIPEPEFEH